ncbi:Uncharacterised protein [Vibrio cholerae]|nr:Uncharacterised protein [Vibrio cholerae]
MAIRQYAVGMLFQGFDVAENIIPASTVQTDNVLFE